MKSDKTSSCGECPLTESCGQQASAGGLSGGRLVGRAAVCFLVPLAAALAASMAVSGQTARFLATVGAFVVTAGLVAAVRGMRRRQLS